MKEQIVKITDYSNVLIADMVISFVFISLGIILWKNETVRWPLIVCGCIYLGATLLWHYS